MALVSLRRVLWDYGNERIRLECQHLGVDFKAIECEYLSQFLTRDQLQAALGEDLLDDRPFSLYVRSQTNTGKTTAQMGLLKDPRCLTDSPRPPVAEVVAFNSRQTQVAALVTAARGQGIKLSSYREFLVPGTQRVDARRLAEEPNVAVCTDSASKLSEHGTRVPQILLMDEKMSTINHVLFAESYLSQRNHAKERADHSVHARRLAQGPQL